MMNILDDLARHAANNPDAPLYTFLDGAGRVTESYSYRRFDERTNELARGLLDTGKLAPGDRALLVYPPGLEFITAFFACVKSGVVPVPVAPPDASGFIGGVEKLAYIAADAGAHIALTSEAFLQQIHWLAERSPEGNAWLQREPLSSVQWVATDQISGRAARVDVAPSELLFLQYTSGSTQAPRGVMVSHANVIHNARATLRHRPIGVSWLPHFHDMGLIGYYLHIMIAGGAMYGFSGAHFLRRPLLWLQTITRYGATITSAPNFAFEYCLREDKVPDEALAALDLSSMVCMMNAAEPVRAATYERFQARFGPCGLSPKAHTVYYGLAENTLSVTGDGRVSLTVNASLLGRNHLKIEPPRDDSYNQSRLMSCGRPLPGIDVRIVPAGTRSTVADGSIGEIWVGGPSKAKGYLNKPTLSDEHFGGRIDGDTTGTTYLRTGDVGFLHDGELFICGRVKDMMIVGGRNYYPADIEAVVEAASPKVRQGCVAAFAIDKGLDGEGIVVLAEAKRSNDVPDLDALSHEIRKRCQLDADLLAVVPHGTINKTSSGKIARQLCRKSWESGEVRPIAQRARTAPSDTDELLEELLNRFDVAGFEDRTLADLGIDSLTLVELSLQLEGLLGEHGSDGTGHAAEVWSDLRILQAVTVGELRALIDDFAATGEIPDDLPATFETRLGTIERDETALMRKDARLPDDIAPRAATVPSGATVLLTGATGFLGSFLLEALLRLTDYQVVVLVRAGNAEHARMRTESALERTALMDAALREGFAQRVRTLPGDLTEPRLGLTPEGWAALSEELSAIYHCGAEVDYVKPYEQLRGPNVSSTVDIVRLAAAGRPKALHYVSTTFMFGFVAREVCLESDANDEMAGLNFGYAQSKWVAEQLVLGAAARGLTTQVYRPSLVTASRHGKYVGGDLMSRILSYMIRHGLTVDSANQLSFVPVDICANNIVALSLLDGAAPPVVNITADSYYTFQDVCASIGRRSGCAFEQVSLERFMEYMNANCSTDDPMFPLLAFFNNNWRRIDRMRDKRYDNTCYREARARSPLVMPESSFDDTVGQIVAFLQRENFVPAPQAQRMTAA